MGGRSLWHTLPSRSHLLPSKLWQPPPLLARSSCGEVASLAPVPASVRCRWQASAFKRRPRWFTPPASRDFEDELVPTPIFTSCSYILALLAPSFSSDVLYFYLYLAALCSGVPDTSQIGSHKLPTDHPCCLNSFFI